MEIGLKLGSTEKNAGTYLETSKQHISIHQTTTRKYYHLACVAGGLCHTLDRLMSAMAGAHKNKNRGT